MWNDLLIAKFCFVVNSGKNRPRSSGDFCLIELQPKLIHFALPFFQGELPYCGTALDIPALKFYCLRMANSLTDLSVSQLKRAVAIKERIEALEKELRDIFGSAEQVADQTGPPRRRKMSAAGRKAIAEAARARWAKVNAGKASTTRPAKAKRTMSAAARAKISAAAKARWAKWKAAKK